MQKFILFALLILSTQSRTRISMDRFTGCTADLFPNPRNFRVLQIKFDDACTAFETCAATYNTNQEECIDKFEIDQIAFCDEYTSVNLWRRRYCKRIVKQNMVLARQLADDKFKNHEKAFEAQIFIPADCLLNDLTLTGAACTSIDDEIFTFVRLGNDKYVIGDGDGKCMNKSVSLVDCDFDDEDQWMNVTKVSTVVSSITDEDGSTLDLSGPTFNTVGGTTVGINVVA